MHQPFPQLRHMSGNTLCETFRAVVMIRLAKNRILLIVFQNRWLVLRLDFLHTAYNLEYEVLSMFEIEDAEHNSTMLQ
jgi:hypothetical protein